MHNNNSNRDLFGLLQIQGQQKFSTTLSRFQNLFAYEHRHRGSDYGKAKQFGLQFESEYTRCRWWEDVSTRDDRDDHHDNIIHEWLDTKPGIKRLGSKKSETFEYDPKRYNLDIIGDMIHEQFLDCFNETNFFNVAISKQYIPI